MHDNTSLRRTTNVEELFPLRKDCRPSAFTWDEIQSLSAGKGFLDVSEERLCRICHDELMGKWELQGSHGQGKSWKSWNFNTACSIQGKSGNFYVFVDIGNIREL